MKKQLIIGLTGQTGSGKSTVSRCLISEGLAVIDCDRISREITYDGSECCKCLSEHFPACFNCDLHLDRAALGTIVFSDGEKLELLNRLIFPFILDAINQRTEELRSQGFEIIVLDAPTLFESGADKLCDIIVSCISSKNIRAERIIARDGITREQAENRIDSQLPDSFYREHSDIVIENSGGIKALENASRFISHILKGRSYGNQKEKA
ncbi:MAG: dephospho-CoA kinase [Ruminococcus sp.]|nr:dephospho-CoA kinase [Ruminococcus sp.]